MGSPVTFLLEERRVVHTTRETEGLGDSLREWAEETQTGRQHTVYDTASSNLFEQMVSNSRKQFLGPTHVMLILISRKRRIFNPFLVYTSLD